MHVQCIRLTSAQQATVIADALHVKRLPPLEALVGQGAEEARVVGALASSPVGSSMGRSLASSSSKQHPSYRLLEQNAFQQEAYEQYRRRCLKERKAVGTYIRSPHQACVIRIVNDCEQGPVQT